MRAKVRSRTRFAPLAANPKATSVALVVSGEPMYVCYVDEAGCTGELPSANSSIQPIFAIAGLMLPALAVPSVTRELIALKQRFFPTRLPATSRYHDWMVLEVKGSDLRRMARSTARNDRRFAYGVIQEGLAILGRHQGRIVGRVYAKPIGGSFDGTSVYSSSVQRICQDFQHLLASEGAPGLVIADSRNKAKNANISHSVFTQMYSAMGNPYPNLVEAPTFGHSDNHAGLQLTDLICSALLFPIAAELCCLRHMTDQTHCFAQHATLRTRYGATLRDLQYRYNPAPGSWAGGISLLDPLNGHKSPMLFA